MAQHISFSNLRRYDLTSDQFFLKTIDETTSDILAHLEAFKNNEPTGCKVIELPEEYLEEAEKIVGYKAYAILSFPCSKDAVIGGKCSIEIHYRNKENFSIFAVA